MARAVGWALLTMWAAGCSELKPGTWAPDAEVVLDAGSVADAGAVADAGPPCPRDRLRCGERCVDPRDDRLNCGACGVHCDGCRDGRCP
jgi:hypothetical protein